MPSCTLNKRGQITIPKEIRDALDLKAGDKLAMEVLATGCVAIRKVAAAVPGAAGKSASSGDRA